MTELRVIITRHNNWIEIYPGTFKVIHAVKWMDYHAIVLNSEAEEKSARDLFLLRYAPDGSPVAVLP